MRRPERLEYQLLQFVIEMPHSLRANCETLASQCDQAVELEEIYNVLNRLARRNLLVLGEDPAIPSHQGDGPEPKRDANFWAGTFFITATATGRAYFKRLQPPIGFIG
jgi:hypothetical protein